MKMMVGKGHMCNTNYLHPGVLDCYSSVPGHEKYFMCEVKRADVIVRPPF